MQVKVNILSGLLRDLEAEIGTRDVSRLVLNALVDSIKVLEVSDPRGFCEQFGQLFEVLSKTEPKFGILNFHFANMKKSFAKNICHGDYCDAEWRKFAITTIETILKEDQGNKEAITKNAEKIDVENKTILIHDHSHTVQDVLCHYKRLGKHFKVLIAEQDFDKTHNNIERMHAAGIPFQVVPAYMLSHVHDQIDMCFFGALTLKDTMTFVMDPGTHGIISEFHYVKVPVYMFMDTTKFSLWKSKQRGDIFIHKHMRKHHSKEIEYERVKYSHDRVPAELFEKIVTNAGVFTPARLKALFMKKMKEAEKAK